MGPNNPWSANWRPDETGRRLVAIRTMKRGALLAGLVFAAVGAAAVLAEDLPGQLAFMAVAIGLPGVALLGAGLAPTTLGSRLDALVAGIALAIGAPVAAVTSVLIGGFFIGMFAGRDLTGAILRTSVTTAVGVAPLVAVAAAVWVLILRWSFRTARPI